MSIKNLINSYINDSENMSSDAKFSLLDRIFFYNSTPIQLATPTTEGIIVGKSRAIELNLTQRVMFSEHNIFCRSRKIVTELQNPTIQDFWEPPVSVASQGRLNPQGESLLYLADNPLTAVAEIGQPQNGSFMLIFYELINNTTLTEIGFSGNNKENDDLLKFLDNLFMKKRDTSQSDGHQIYEITNYIAKRYKNYGDGWVYPSTVSNGVNFCLLSSKKINLNIVASINIINGIFKSKYLFKDKNDIQLIQLSEVEAREEWRHLVDLSQKNSFKVPENFELPNNPAPVVTMLPPAILLPLSLIVKK